MTIVAPAGYGKTTVMAQWMATEMRPTAWLSLDRSNNDPAVLIADLKAALTAADLIKSGARDQLRLTSEMALTRGVDHLVGEVERQGVSGVLLLDHLDSVRTRSALDVLSAFLTHIPDNLQVVLASRSTAGLPLALLRTRGGVVELSVSDLAMEASEAAELIVGAGVKVGDAVDDIVKRTEGWPAGIYLTTLAIREGAPAASAPDVRGDDIFLVDYLRQEVLGHLSDSEMSFLTRSSILTRFSGPLCDFVLETNGSARFLEVLHESNLLIVAMDRTRTWYRYHSLLRDFLRSELERRQPDAIASLHSRAATWLDENGQPELAIDHARAAGEGERVADIVSRVARITYAHGRMDTLSAWLNWLEKNGTIRRFPDLAAVGAFARSLEGDAGGADRLAVYAFTDDEGETVADDHLGPFARILRSYQASKGLDVAVMDARAARKALSPTSDWLHVAMGAEALALMADGKDDAADAIWVEAVQLSAGLEASPFTSGGLAHRALIAIRRGDWDAAGDLIERSVRLIDRGGLEPYITSALTFAVAARLAIRRGEIPEAKALMGRAAAIRPRLTTAVPTLALQSLLAMSRCYIELADMAGARRVMHEASDIIALRPRLGVLRSDHDELNARLSSLPAGAVGASSLTSAELRLLPLLVTHLSYPEIGERLFVSRHTVKTQAMSIYRKLGVSSRSEAVEKARGIGLVSL